MNYTILVLFIAGVASICPGERLCRQCNIPKEQKTGTCEVCHKSFLNKEGRCDSNVKNIVDHCIKYVVAGDVIKCDLCEMDYGLSKNACKKCSNKCAVCAFNENEEETCKACSGHQTFGKTKECTFNKECEAMGCDVCEDLGDGKLKCWNCDKGLAIADNGAKCAKSTENCLKADPANANLCNLC